MWRDAITEPIELGLQSLAQLEERLRPVERYQELFAAAFRNEAEPITQQSLAVSW